MPLIRLIFRVCCCTALLSFYTPLQAQASDPVADSLVCIISQQSVDTLRMLRTFDLIEHLVRSDAPRAIKIAHETAVFCKRKQWKRGLSTIAQSLSIAHKVSGNIDSAIYYGWISIDLDKLSGNAHDMGRSMNSQGANYLASGDIAKGKKLLLRAQEYSSMAGDSSGLGDIFINLALAASMEGDIHKTLEYDIQALKIYESLHYDKMLGGAYNNLAIDYSELKEFAEAENFATKAISISKKINDLGTEINARINLGNIYHDSGKRNEALSVFNETIALIRKLGSDVRLIEIYTNIGEICSEELQFDRANQFFRMALELAHHFNDTYSVMYVSRHLGNNSLQKQQYDRAIAYLVEAERIAQNDSLLEDLELIYSNMAACFSAKGNFEKAYTYERKLSQLKSKRGQQEMAEQLARMKTAFDTERKQHQIEVLNKEQIIKDEEIHYQKYIRNGVLVSLTVVIILLVFVLFQKRRIAHEKQRSEDLLLNILPYETAQELKVSGNSQAKYFDQVTVLFTDFKGFTQVAELLSPHELVAEIHHCFKAFDLIMERYQIEKIKTIGDAYMAAAGLPVEQKTNAQAMVYAALEIQAFILNYAKQREQAGKPRFDIRIGIHTGPVVAGIVGVKKFQYDIWGDTVNIASRMESSGEAGQINISASTYQIVQHDFDCVHRGKIMAKGKGEVDMYFVNGRKINPSATQEQPTA